MKITKYNWIGAVIGFFSVGLIRALYEGANIIQMNTIYYIDKVFTLQEFVVFVVGATALGFYLGGKLK